MLIALALLLAPLLPTPAVADPTGFPICSAHTAEAPHGGAPSDQRHQAGCCLIACCAGVVAAVLPIPPLLPQPTVQVGSSVPASWRAPPPRGPPCAFSARAPPRSA